MLPPSMRRTWLVALLALACACAKVTVPEGPVPEPPPPAPVSPPPPVVPPPRTPADLYSLDEAVEDALAGPWTYVGTGPWTGNARVKACAYRNDRVLIVDVYCTIKEVKAFRVDVFSPTRGRVRIYAEARTPISGLTRRDYFTFTGESEPPPSPRTGLPPVSLTMSFADLLSYDGRRYRAFLPTCFGGVEIDRRQGGCGRGLGGHAREWADTNRAFLREPPEGWYRMVSELRALARQHGQDPP
jgi:hypothetical protein